jgi:pimeloyl-ACP methyl ester carboxylesterase
MSSFLAPPAKMAWQQIGAVVASVQQEPILRAWTQYSPHVVWQALRALGRLQDAVPNNTTLVVESSSSPLADDEVHVVGRDLAYYSVYATLAYGWFLALVQGQWRGGGSLRTVLQRTGLNETHILDAVWQAETHRPAYLLVRDPVKRSIVLTIRGTWSASDMLTDLCCSTTVLSAPTNTTTLWEWLRPAHRKTTLEAHAGMVQAALALRDSLQDKVAAALHAHPDHQLVLVGHSMGGGVAAILGLLWQNVFDGEAPPRVYLYGPPCVAAFESPLTQHANIHSVVLPGDPFCTLSLGHVTELAAAVDYLGRHDPLRRRLCRRPLSPAYAQEIWDLLAAHIEPRLSGNSTLYTKHVPPGRLWRLVPQRTHRWPRKRHWKLQGVATSDFLTLSLQPLALDLTQHVPALYEDCLQSIYNK